jgi:DNA-binding transcriptional MerR regulator
MLPHISTSMVSDVTGATARQLDYWARTGLLPPSGRRAAGRGSRRRYSFRDVVAAMTVLELRRKGCSLQTIRKVVRKLRAHFPDESDTSMLARLTLLTDGQRVYMLQADTQQARDILARQHVWAIALGLIIQTARDKVQHVPMEWTETVKVRGGTYHLLVTRDQEAGGFVVQCRELPGALGQAETVEGALNDGKAAIESVLQFRARRLGLRKKAGRARVKATG